MVLRTFLKLMNCLHMRYKTHYGKVSVKTLGPENKLAIVINYNITAINSPLLVFLFSPLKDNTEKGNATC